MGELKGDKHSAFWHPFFLILFESFRAEQEETMCPA